MISKYIMYDVSKAIRDLVVLCLQRVDVTSIVTSHVRTEPLEKLAHVVQVVLRVDPAA